jgi:hypothetical protein
MDRKVADGHFVTPGSYSSNDANGWAGIEHVHTLGLADPVYCATREALKGRLHFGKAP